MAFTLTWETRSAIPFGSVGITRFVLMIRKASNLHFQQKRLYKMIASRQVVIPLFRGFDWQRGRGSLHLHKVLGELLIPFSFKNFVPASKRVCSDLLEFGAPETVEVFSGRKIFKTAAKSVGRQNLRKQLSKDSRNRKGAKSGKEVAQRKQASRFSQQNLQNRPVGFYKYLPLIMSSNFRYQLLVVVSGNFGGKVPVVDDVLSSHEQESYPTTTLAGSCI